MKMMRDEGAINVPFYVPKTKKEKQMKFIIVFVAGICIGIQWGLNKKHIKSEIKKQRRLALYNARCSAVNFRMWWQTYKANRRPYVAATKENERY